MAGIFLGFRIRLRFPGCRTLKDRRMRVEGLIHTAKRRHGFSAADLTDPLKSDYAEIGLTAVGQTASEIRKRVELIIETVENGGETQILGIEELVLSEGL